MKTFEVTITDDLYDHLKEFGEACGYAFHPCSRIVPMLIAAAVKAPGIIAPSKVPPIIVRPTSEEQRAEYEAYAKVKGYESLAAFALQAMELTISKNRPTKRQARRLDELTRNFAR